MWYNNRTAFFHGFESEFWQAKGFRSWAALIKQVTLLTRSGVLVLVVVLVPVTLRTRRRGSVGLRGARSRSFDAINYWPLVRQSIVDTLQIQSTKYFLIQSITDPWPDNPNLICDDLTFTSSWCYCTIVLGTEAFHFYACLESKYHLTSEYGIWVGKVKIDHIIVINYMAIWKTGVDSTYVML